MQGLASRGRTSNQGAMMVDNFRFRFGIEEEYFLVDAQTKRVARRMPEKFLMAANKATDGLVTGEFLQSQLEVATSPHFSFANARSQLPACGRSWRRSRPNMGLRYLPRELI